MAAHTRASTISSLDHFVSSAGGPQLTMDRSKSDEDEEQQAFLEQTGATRNVSQSKKTSRPKATGYMRWVIEILMAITIVVLLVRPIANNGTPKPSPVPKCAFSSCIPCKTGPVANKAMRNSSSTKNVHIRRGSKVHARGHVLQRERHPSYTP